jgi:hypothetical protein
MSEKSSVTVPLGIDIFSVLRKRRDERARIRTPRRHLRERTHGIGTTQDRSRGRFGSIGTALVVQKVALPHF